MLEAIAGAFRADARTAEPGAVRREDGSWLLAGWLPARLGRAQHPRHRLFAGV